MERAREQYRLVLHRWHYGELRRRRTKLDGFFDLTGDVSEALDKAKGFIDGVIDKYF